MYPGYLSVVVDAHMIVETIWLIWALVGFYSLSLSVATLSSAKLSMMTEASTFYINLFRVSMQL